MNAEDLHAEDASRINPTQYALAKVSCCQSVRTSLCLRPLATRFRLLCWRRDWPAPDLHDATLRLPHQASRAQQSSKLIAGNVLVQDLAKTILDVKGDYDPEDNLALQVQARPNDIEGFNLQVRARLCAECAAVCLKLCKAKDEGLMLAGLSAERLESLSQAPRRRLYLAGSQFRPAVGHPAREDTIPWDHGRAGGGLCSSARL